MSARIGSLRPFAFVAATAALLAGGFALKTRATQAEGAAQAARLQMAYTPERTALVVSGWSDAELEVMRGFEASDASWSDLLAVRINLDKPNDSQPAVLGTYKLEGRELLFRPRFGWSPGSSYRAEVEPATLSPDASGGPQLQRASFGIPGVSVPDEPPRVTAVYPTADRVPENLLRFYIEFSHPMELGNAKAEVKLVDSSGADVLSPFLSIRHELWDSEMKTLTVMLDPGRIKEGLAPNLQAGAPIKAATSYQLVIGTGFTDEHGRNIVTEHRKPFFVEDPDRQGPDPKKWAIEPPKAQQRTPLVLRLDDSIDRYLAPRMLRFETSVGQRLAGTVTVRNDQRVVEFVPEQVWKPGSYRLAVHPTLEDYSGNQIIAPFDMPAGSVAKLAETQAAEKIIYRPFAVDG